MNATLATLVVVVASAAATVAAEAAPTSPTGTLGSAIVVQDQASLRAAPRDGAQQQTVFWQGEVLEVRGERLDYLQVWDHKRERGGFIRASEVRRVALTEAEAPALLAVVRFVQDTPGAEALGIGLRQTWSATVMMVTGIGQIFMGDRSVDELGGPITMAKFSGEQLSLGWAPFVSFVAFISLNLAFINLLPIPVLDGGHLAFYAAEAVRRKPASPRSQELAFRTGLALVLGLMLFVTIVDIAKLPLFGS